MSSLHKSSLTAFLSLARWCVILTHRQRREKGSFPWDWWPEKLKNMWVEAGLFLLATTFMSTEVCLWFVPLEPEQCRLWTGLRGVVWASLWFTLGFPDGSDGKESACNPGVLGLIPGLRWFPGEGNGNPLQCSCLENSVDRGAWRATVHGGLTFSSHAASSPC